jgi:hypothetical protein
MALDEDSLERLFLDNKAFEDVASALDVFCPFDAVGMDRQEIRHGFFLRYMLDPHRPHGFGVECLRGFMWAAAAALRDAGDTGIKPLDVHLMDLESAIVEREYSSIDLLIQIPTEKVVVAVELKIDATEHSGQLGRYRKLVEKEFPKSDGWRQLFLFLTKRGDDPSEEDGQGWSALPLEAVVEMLSRVLSKGSGQPDAQVMLNAYVSMLRRRHLTDPRLEELARGLWREHREVLDFLMSRKPDVGYEVFSAMLDDQAAVAASFSVATQLKIIPDQSTKTYLRFAIEDWDSVPGMLTGTGWKPSNRMLLFEMWRTTNGGIRCKVELGPGDPESRERLFQAFKAAGADVGGNWQLAAKWRQLAAKQLANPAEDDDPTDVRLQVMNGATQFLKSHLPKYDAGIKTLVA